jgi:hypothetical protein
MRCLVDIILIFCMLGIFLSLVQPIVQSEKYDIDFDTMKDIEFRNFYSVGELQKFLKEDKTDEKEYTAEIHDCDDFAIELVEAAEKRGYRLFIQRIETTSSDNTTSAHMVCSAVIRGKLWYIEPSNDNIWINSQLDRSMPIFS